jgi:hypothetical protein
VSLFPKAEAVTEITALADQFRAAALELDEIAARAPTLEVGTLRRQTNAVRLSVANALTSEGVEDNG